MFLLLKPSSGKTHDYYIHTLLNCVCQYKCYTVSDIRIDVAYAGDSYFFLYYVIVSGAAEKTSMIMDMVNWDNDI
jgi:hypothetical protein